MKIRSGFVSNSSSSSFCIMGAWIGEKELLKVIEKVNPGVYQKYTNEELDLWDAADYLYGNPDFEYYVQDYDDAMFGIPMTDMKDSETLGEFRAKAQEVFDKYGIDKKVGIQYGEISDY